MQILCKYLHVDNQSVFLKSKDFNFYAIYRFNQRGIHINTQYLVKLHEVAAELCDRLNIKPTISIFIQP